MNDIEEVVDRKAVTSRFALYHGVYLQKRKAKRSRELSRIPLKALKKVLKKRSRRKVVIRNILNNLPQSSVVYELMETSLLRKGLMFGCDKPVRELKDYKNRRYSRRSIAKSVIYRSVNHKSMYIRSKLYNDIEMNPGPNIVDSSKTICAPYRQGDSSVFGGNAGTQCAGTQCVAMSLSAILYNFDHIIKSSCDLVEIVNVGNDMYTILSRAAQQEYLLLSEIPAVVCIREEDFNLQYSESFYGMLFQNNVMEESNCVPLQLAFDSLLIEGYQSFLLTITILECRFFSRVEGRG